MKLTKKLIDNYLKEKLSTDSKWALHALMRIYDRQTPGEQASDTTNVDNNIGFSGADAEILSSFAKQYQQRKTLSPKQMAIVFKKMKKYRKQILSISDDNKLFNCMIKDNVITEGDLVAYQEAIAAKRFLDAL